MWVSKLMGYEFEIQYKEGVENKAADALSRVEGAEMLPMLLNNAATNLLSSIQNSWVADPYLQGIITDLKRDDQTHPKFTWSQDQLRRLGKLVVGNDDEVKTSILRWLHDSAVGGHSGRDVTTARIKSLFFWKHMTKEIAEYIKNCHVCLRNKSEQVAPLACYNL